MQQKDVIKIIYNIIFFFFKYLVNNVKLVRPEKAKAIEDMIIRNGTAGAIQDKITEDQLISYLENFKEFSRQQKNWVYFYENIPNSYH